MKLAVTKNGSGDISAMSIVDQMRWGESGMRRARNPQWGGEGDEFGLQYLLNPINIKVHASLSAIIKGEMGAE